MEFTNRPTQALINLSNLRHNVKFVRSRVPQGQDIMAIVKADGYGHGGVMVARTLEGCGIKKLGVATFEEGLHLRKHGIRAEIFVLDGLLGPVQEYVSHRLYPVLFQLESLQQFCEFATKENRTVMAALKFDTGMGRLGFLPPQVDEVAGLVKKCLQLNVSLAMTHLSKADVGDGEFTRRQYTLFKKLCGLLEERGVKVPQLSICNSAAILDGLCEDFHCVRPGICLYGCHPHKRFVEGTDLKPVMQLTTKIIHLKQVPRGHGVGYGATFVADRNLRLAVLPVGYADGYPRLVSNIGHVLVCGRRAPIVGRISMDLMAVNVTDIPAAKLFDDVVLIGEQDGSLIRAEDVAEWAQTISYEIVCGITARVPRIYEGV